MNQRKLKKIFFQFILVVLVFFGIVCTLNQLEVKAFEESQESSVEVVSSDSGSKEETEAHLIIGESQSETVLTITEATTDELVPLKDEEQEASHTNSDDSSQIDKTSTDVSNWQSFIAALSDASIRTINIVADFDVPTKFTEGLAFNSYRSLGTNISGGLAYLWLTTSGISREVVIEGNNHEIDFKALALSTDPKTVNDLSPWSFTWKNISTYHGNYFGFFNFTGLTNVQATVSTIIYDNVKDVGNQLIHSPKGDVEIRGHTTSFQQEIYTSKAGDWKINLANQANMSVSNLIVKKNATLTVSTINAGNIELGTLAPGNLVLEENAILNATANGTSNLIGEAYGTNLFVKEGNVTLKDGAKLNLKPKPNSSAISLFSTGANLVIGKDAQININSKDSNRNGDSFSTNIIWMADGSSLIIGQRGALNITATGMEASGSHIIYVAGNAYFTVEKEGILDVKSDSVSPNQYLIQFNSNGSVFQFADAQRVNLQRTALINNGLSMAASGLINITDNGGKLELDIQKVSLWQQGDFAESPTAKWMPMYEMLLNYSFVTPTIVTASSLTQATEDDFKSTFTTKNVQRVLFERIPEVTVSFQSQAVDLPVNPHARLVQGTTNPGAYVRLVDTPINNTVTAAIIPSDQELVSMVTASGQPEELTANYTVKADAAGNFTFLIADESRKGFSAGSTIELFAFLDGKSARATQSVLDTTPPTGEGKDYHAKKGVNVPAAKDLVQNITDTNPEEQNYTYDYSAENPVEELARMMDIVGEHNVKIDVSDAAGNKTTIPSSLIIHESGNEIYGRDVKVGIDFLKTMDVSQLEKYISEMSEPTAQAIVGGQLTDLTSYIQLKNLGGLTPDSTSGTYQVILVIKKEEAGLEADLEKVISVEIETENTTLTLNFVNEVGTIIYTDNLVKSVGEVVDLTKEQVVLGGLEFMAARKYLLVQGPKNESTYIFSNNDTTLLYRFTGALFIELVPTEIDFGTQRASIFDTKVEKPTFDQPFIIGDSRANSGDWTLKVALQQPLTHQEDASKVILEALTYKVDGDTTITLGSQAQPVTSSKDCIIRESNGSEDSRTIFYTISESWLSGESGLQLNIPAGSIRKLGAYQATIVWQLEETP